MAAAAATLSDSVPAAMGMATRSDAKASSRGETPAPSAPNSQAVSPESTTSRSPRSARAVAQRTRPLNSRTAAARSSTCRMPTRKWPPAPARKTFADHGSAHCRSSTTLPAPKAAALRTMAPTLPASCTPSRNTVVPRRSSVGMSSSAAIPCGVPASTIDEKMPLAITTGETRARRTSCDASGRVRPASVPSTAFGTNPASRAAPRRCGPSIRMRRSLRRKRPSRTSLAQRLTCALSFDLIRRAWRAGQRGLAQHVVDQVDVRLGRRRGAHLGVLALQLAAPHVERGQLQARIHGELHRVAVHAVALHAQLFLHQSPGLGEEVLLEEHADRIEAAPVDLAGAQTPERFEVLRRGIALVAVEAVPWIALVQRRHFCVARGLGQDRGGGDALLLGVAVDDGPGAAREAGRTGLPVDEGLCGLDRKPGHGAPHGEHRGM